MTLLEQAKAHQAWSVSHRRHLHQHPELSLYEEKTAQYCQKVLAELGYNINTNWKFGFIADLNVGADKTIALRADMDALPMQEKNTHDFVSKRPDAAHMCGHDVHMAIALTAARLLVENKQQLTANVRLLFQPSEELHPGGAISMIENGCLDGVDEVYGLHNNPGMEVGTIATRVGPLTASADMFTLSITGKGGHAARPQDCLDPINVTCQLVTQWQSLISRRINPVHTAVLSVCKIHAGDTFNVIPETAEIAGTVRTFDAHDRDLIENGMQNSFYPYEKMGFKFDFLYTRGYDSIVNHKNNVERIVAAAKVIIGEQNVNVNMDRAAWGEDFCYYLQKIPGAFFILGSGNREKGINEPLHSSHFEIDESALPIGAAIMAQIILE